MITLNNTTTGQTPAQWIGQEFGGRDDFARTDWAFSGCLDAPWKVPAGGMTNDNYDAAPVGQFATR
jgi:hypothetical protein